MDLRTPSFDRLLDIWIDEDLGRGDLTQFALNESIVNAHWITKQEGIFCGGAIVNKIFQRIDPSIEIELLTTDGSSIHTGQKILNIKGPATSLIAGERAGLNLAMHLSGVATATALLVTELEGTGVRLADTRKTTPGLRLMEKYAVRCGGGINHRMGLDDAAMLKENHIAWGNGIEEAIEIIRTKNPWTTKIIVEAETCEQAEQAVKGGADGILLDGMTPQLIDSLVPHLRDLARISNKNRISNQIVIEASGIDPKELKKYASTGIDLISTSAPITRSHWIDFSMRFNSNIER